MVGGTIQASFSRGFKKTVVGGAVGSTVGTIITDALNNWDPDSANASMQEMKKNAATSFGKASITNSLTGYVGVAADAAKADGCGGLQPTFTYGFAEAVKAFYSWVDDAMVYIWGE